MNARAGVLAAAILGALVALSALIWEYPKILLYVLLGLIGVLAWAALYLIVSARMKREEELEPPRPEPDEKSDSPP